MYNSDTPLRSELPSSRQLLRSTILAAIAALVLLVAVVLPAEYGIDPTGVGRVLRMTEMGDIKQQLAAEAAADAAAANTAKAPVMAVAADSPKAQAQATAPRIEWRDETPFTLTPGQGTEIKLTMLEGAKAQYAWAVEGGEVNFDTHGDAPGKSISYEKGRGVSSDDGVLEAAFTGNHGWYWRNRGKSDVKVIVRTRGDYTDIKKVM
jgi:hypothetical protein